MNQNEEKKEENVTSVVHKCLFVCLCNLQNKQTNKQNQTNKQTKLTKLIAKKKTEIKIKMNK